MSVLSIILAVDTSATPVSCALLQDGQALASYYAHTKSTHSQTLMPMLEQALSLNNLTMDDIDIVAVNNGPGSFTGVRIGVSAVKGLAFTHNKPCVEVSTLECIAEGFRGMPVNAIICCTMDARCQQVYTALFELTDDGVLTRCSPDEALPLDELKSRLTTIVDTPIIFAGDGAALCIKSFKNDLKNIHIAPLALRYQSALQVAAVAVCKIESNTTISDEELLPSYLRLPQAERELRARQGLT